MILRLQTVEQRRKEVGAVVLAMRLDVLSNAVMLTQCVNEFCSLPCDFTSAVLDKHKMRGRGAGLQVNILTID